MSGLTRAASGPAAARKGARLRYWEPPAILRPRPAQDARGPAGAVAETP